MAQRYAAQMAPRAPDGVGRVARRGRPRGAPESASTPPEAVQQTLDLAAPSAAAASKPASSESDLVHADTLELLDPRSVGVESLALHALTELGIIEGLRGAGFNRVSMAAAPRTCAKPPSLMPKRLRSTGPLVRTAKPVAQSSATSAPSGTCELHRVVPQARKKSPKLLFYKAIFSR
jgi:hypothetical protein